MLTFNTVLVAYNGFVFDFPMLLAEVKCRSGTLDPSVFKEMKIHFGDTLPLVRQVGDYTIRNLRRILILTDEEIWGHQGDQAWN